MVANMASIIADIGDRSAPAADGGGRRAGPSRICIGISSSPPPFPGSPHAAARHASARARHGPRRRDLRAAPESSGVRVRGEVPRLWKLVEPAAAAAGGAVEGGSARGAGWCVTNGFGSFSPAAIWKLEKPMKAASPRGKVGRKIV